MWLRSRDQSFVNAKYGWKEDPSDRQIEMGEILSKDSTNGPQGTAPPQETRVRLLFMREYGQDETAL
jgi:hypothetical protein